MCFPGGFNLRDFFLKKIYQNICWIDLFSLLLIYQTKQNTTNMNTAEQQIRAEFKKRTDLIEQKEFRVKCAQIAEEMGMSADEWNKNKAKILLWMANKVISQAEQAMA